MGFKKFYFAYFIIAIKEKLNLLYIKFVLAEKLCKFVVLLILSI